MEKRIITDNYDIGGQSIWRTIRLSAFGKYIPIGNLASGPGMRCLVTLAVLHAFGNYMYSLQIKYGEKLTWLNKKLF